MKSMTTINGLTSTIDQCDDDDGEMEMNELLIVELMETIRVSIREPLDMIANPK